MLGQPDGRGRPSGVDLAEVEKPLKNLAFSHLPTVPRELGRGFCQDLPLFPRPPVRPGQALVRAAERGFLPFVQRAAGISYEPTSAVPRSFNGSRRPMSGFPRSSRRGAAGDSSRPSFPYEPTSAGSPVRSAGSRRPTSAGSPFVQPDGRLTGEAPTGRALAPRSVRSAERCASPPSVRSRSRWRR